LYTLDSSYAEAGNKTRLNIVFDAESYFSAFHVICSNDTPMSGGGAYFDAFEYLHDNDCIAGDESPSDPGR